MKRNTLVPVAFVGVLLCVHAARAQTPATPLPPRHAGPLYKVPGQLFPFDPATGQPVLPPALQAQLDKRHHGGSLAGQGNAAAAQGDWTQAVTDYQEALSLDPDNLVALYGLGDYASTKSYTQAALGYYRQAIYTHPDPPALPQFQESNGYRLMEYALLLSQTGQQPEALTVYRHGAQILSARLANMMPLPDFGDGTGQVPFTPQRLQAMAQVGWAYDHSDFDQEARYGTDYKAAGADFDKAAQLSDQAEADAVQQERHLFQYRIDAATQAAQAQKTVP